MRKTYHISFSSHEEVLYRDVSDFVYGFNCLAISSLLTESRLLADGHMSTHLHKLIQTDNPDEVMKRSRYAYTRRFNAKYHRRGSLSGGPYFILPVEGLFHMQAALNYVNRQGLHHGLTSTPFEYPHCSAGTYFRKELGRPTPDLLADNSLRYKTLPEGVSIPEQYRMSSSGLLLREDIIDTSYVEEVYISARNFLYQMNKTSDDRSVQEQINENSLPPITLEAMEQGVAGFDTRQALINEQGKVNYNRLTDIELCNIIDKRILPERYFKDGEDVSIYLLPEYKRAEIGTMLLEESQAAKYGNNGYWLGGKTVTDSQIRRCLVIR